MCVLRWLTLSAFGIVLLAVCLWPEHGPHLDYPIRPDRIGKEQGFAYITTLPAIPSFFIASDDLDHPDRSSAVVLENRVRLGPAHSQHEIIRVKGRGSFSKWNRGLYFSTSDNSDPRTNGRAYSLRVDFQPGRNALLLLLGLLVLCGALHRSDLSRWRRRISAFVRGSDFHDSPGDNLLWALLVALALPFFFLIEGEFWIRFGHPEMFAGVKYPVIWDPEVGFKFAPHAEIEYTNHLDYWARQETNSYGFPDRDWSEKIQPDSLRVAFIGNSFVEAVQVPIAEKLQVRFEEKANQVFAPLKFETAAFGVSGTGQASQLSFYDYAAKYFRPDVVVLVVNSTDFAFNSAILESVLNGWHPDHLPRPFLIRKTRSALFTPAPPDPAWGQFLLDPKPFNTERRAIDSARDWLEENSCFYAWLSAAIPLRFPGTAFFQREQITMAETILRRIATIRSLPGYEHSLDGWHYPDDWDAPRMFAARRLAPVFQEGVASTAAALDAFVARSKSDRFRVIILTTALVSNDISDSRVENETGNRGIERGYLVRLRQLAAQRGIPIVEFGGYPERRGVDPARTHWAHDFHWNALGHQLAAEAMVEALQEHPDWMDRSREGDERKSNAPIPPSKSEINEGRGRLGRPQKIDCCRQQHGSD
jgi:hypothetical protein